MQLQGKRGASYAFHLWYELERWSCVIKLKIYLAASWDTKAAAKATAPIRRETRRSRRTPSHLPLAIAIIYDWLWTSWYLQEGNHIYWNQLSSKTLPFSPISWGWQQDLFHIPRLPWRLDLRKTVLGTNLSFGRNPFKRELIEPAVFDRDVAKQHEMLW